MRCEEGTIVKKKREGQGDEESAKCSLPQRDLKVRNKSEHRPKTQQKGKQQEKV